MKPIHSLREYLRAFYGMVFSFASGILSDSRKTALLAVLIVGLYTIKTGSSWSSHPHESPYQFRNDVDQYYSYLPAAFIHNDLSFSFEHSYWLLPNQNGVLLPKVSMGMAYMYLPFFLIGHAVARATDYPADGYSKPYSVAVRAGTVFYFLVGLFFLVWALHGYFGGLVSLLTGLAVFFGTNLLHYVLNEGEYPHSYLFAIYSVVIWLIIRWHRNPLRRYLFPMAFLLGLAVVIRPVEMVFLMFPVLFGIYDRQSFSAKCKLLGSQWKNILIAGIFFLLPVVPQLMYWKWAGGSWLVFSYGSNERFFLTDPKIGDFLFSFRKGWFVYTPLMLFAIFGFFVLWRKMKDWSAALPIFILFSVYLLSSWWCWWFGGGLGMRAMVQYYVFLAFPLAALMDYMKGQRLAMTILTLPMVFSLWLGYENNYKYRFHRIHWDGMTKSAFWYSMSKNRFSAEDFVHFESLLESPDYDAAQRGER